MKRLIVTTCLCVLFTTSFALADWRPGDPYKMHQPQLPDPQGWDVYATESSTFPRVLADDWRCISTGPVSDIHLWGSWMGDQEGTIHSIHASIHKNVPAGVDTEWSHPGDQLWEQDFTPEQFTVRPYGEGVQGWYDPFTGEYLPEDHRYFHQINIQEIDAPFIQEQGEIYWLDISVKAYFPDGQEASWGWKSSLDQFYDAAVYGDGTPDEWMPLRYPSGNAMDLAFVITPEPTTIALLGLGSLVLLRKRRA